MLGDIASRVRLDEEVKVALVFVRGDGSVRANDFFGLASDGGAEGDVLADGEAEDVGLARELETVAGYVSCIACYCSEAHTWRCCAIGQSSPRARTPGTQ
jgi:hypothetical protein